MTGPIKALFISTLFTLCFCSAYADKINIKNFTLKENPAISNEVIIVAVDTAGITQEGINGEFLFSINGFDKTLKFDNGLAFYHQKLSKSTFLYVKHENEAGSKSNLFYVYKTDLKLIPIRVSWIILFAIPIILIVLGYMFKRFIIIAVVLFGVFVYFNHSGGLGLSTFFETVVDGLRHMF